MRHTVLLSTLVLSLLLSPAALAQATYTDAYEAIERRDYEAAMASASSLVEQGNVEAHELLALVHYYYGRYDKAREHLAQAAGGGLVGQKLNALLENPFAAKYGEDAEHFEGYSRHKLYHVVTDLSAKQAPLNRLRRGVTTPGHQDAAFWLELIHREYARVFKGKRDRKLVSRVVIFAQRSDYLSWCATSYGNPMSGAQAFYDPQTHTLVVSCIDGVRPTIDPSTRAVIFHEAFHQFIDFYISGCPDWFNEGLAEYFGGAEVVKRGSGARIKLGAKQHERRLVIKEAVRQGRHTPLRQLMQMNHSAFMADGNLHYAQAWSLCYYLAQGPLGKRGTKMLQDYFSALRDGGSEQQAFDKAFGKVRFDRLEQDWCHYVSNKL